MAKRWYVVHTYSGYEEKVKKALEKRIKESGRESEFGEILVPKEDLIEIKKGEKKLTKRKLFPAYILVQMEMNEENWHLVRKTPKVTGFVGEPTNPYYLRDEEVEQLTRRIEEEKVNPKHKVSFIQGEVVRIIDGPFANFTGVVDEVKPDKGRLRVLVSILGRSTPVELEYSQVDKG
jgi:transcriptional antiterminator NusG